MGQVLKSPVRERKRERERKKGERARFETRRTPRLELTSKGWKGMPCTWNSMS
jgi:hypothetical protein